MLSNHNNMIIAIITSYGDSLGMGHIQRIASLAWYLNEYKNTRAYLVLGNARSFPPELRYCVKKNIDFSPDIIIRDMRDSSEQEIEKLKENGKVLVIDDNGSGRRSADFALDILPNPEKPDEGSKNRYFLYGYNFLKSLSKLKGRKIRKELDFSIYPGNSATDEYIDFLTALLPKGAGYAMLGRDPYAVKGGVRKSLKESSYAETILSSKAIMSHFGITLYEGFISKCRLISVNPSEYHSKLSELAKEDLDLINLGEHNRINVQEASRLIRDIPSSSLCESINPEDVYKEIINGLEGFFNLLTGIYTQLK